MQSLSQWPESPKVEPRPTEASATPSAGEFQITTPKARHYWKPLILLLFFWASGVASSIGHIQTQETRSTVDNDNTEQYF